MADAADGGNDWELVSLTASAYAAAPGPISPPPMLQFDPAAATSEQSQPSPPPHHSATFMSQHFSLSAEEAPADLLNGGRQELESTPAMPPLDSGLGIPCPKKNSCESETGTLDCNQPTRSSDSVIVWNDKERKISPSATLDDAGSDRTRSASPPPRCHVSAAAATDGIAVGSTAACLPAPVAAPPRAPCEAWWKKTFSFLRGNATESLTFRFVFVADKLQLRLEFGVHGQRISCAASETLAQVKVGMLGGSPVGDGHAHTGIADSSLEPDASPHRL